MPLLHNPDTGQTYRLRRDEVVFRKSLLLATIIFLTPNILAVVYEILYLSLVDMTLLQQVDSFFALPVDAQNILVLKVLTTEIILLIASIPIAIVFTDPKVDFPDDT